MSAHIRTTIEQILYSQDELKQTKKNLLNNNETWGRKNSPCVVVMRFTRDLRSVPLELYLKNNQKLGCAEQVWFDTESHSTSTLTRWICCHGFIL